MNENNVRLANGHINFDKLRAMAAKLQRLQQCMESRFPFQSSEPLQARLVPDAGAGGFCYYSEARLMALSRTREPRAPPRPAQPAPRRTTLSARSSPVKPRPFGLHRFQSNPRFGDA